MAVGKVSTRVLTDIANAIRRQNGTAKSYKPREMAAAVAALDGTRAGTPGVEAYKELESGVVSSKALDAIGTAIRAQNGGTTKYKPSEMAAAILALEWGGGLKVRALLLEGGVMEFNYLDTRRSAIGSTVVQAFDVDLAGYASADARPWKDVRASVKTVRLDASLKGAGITSCAYWFNGFSALRTVVGFENLAGMEDATQMFTSCSELRTISATAFDPSTIKKGASVLYGCTRLVGGTDGFVPTNMSGASVLKVGAGGVLTHPEDDSRTWLNATLFADGELCIGLARADAAGREVVASDNVCANAKYTAIMCAPWSGASKQVRRVTIAEDASRLAAVNLNYWFYGCTALESVEGLSRLRGVSCMNYTFNTCSALTSLDLHGMDPGSLASLSYTFASCSSLARIVVDASWTLPKGCAGAQTFYNCKALVGGNGTAFSSGNAGYAMMRVDVEGSPGYLTAG